MTAAFAALKAASADLESHWSDADFLTYWSRFLDASASYAASLGGEA